jgi:C1A family cysteine protease
MLLLLSLLVLVNSQITSEKATNVFLFENFIQTYGKTYSSDVEYWQRYEIFVKNLKLADERNQMEGSQVHGVTKFMDLTPVEFKKYLGFIPSEYTGKVELAVTCPKKLKASAASYCGASNATDCDYAQLGSVTPVKDQGQCGSCWAFSATEATETATFIAGKALPILSPQEIVDCDKTDGGCNGGDTPTAYEFIIKEGGLESEASYPYTGKDGTCKFNASKVVATISSYKWAIPPCNTAATRNCDNQDEAGLKTFVQNQGPVSICVDAEPWQTYTSGVFSSSTCKHGYNELDHCVHLTGYGVESAKQYWLVKNSWGTNWGEKGYIKIAYGSNLCGIADEATIAVAP